MPCGLRSSKSIQFLAKITDLKEANEKNPSLGLSLLFMHVMCELHLHYANKIYIYIYFLPPPNLPFFQ